MTAHVQSDDATVRRKSVQLRSKHGSGLRPSGHQYQGWAAASLKKMEIYAIVCFDLSAAWAYGLI
jgi:hypothetical protein